MACLAQTVLRRSVEAYEATAVVPSLMGVDELTVRWQGTARVLRRLPFKPVGAGVEIYSILSSYNSSLGGVDRCDTLLVLEQQVLPEDVLR